MRLMTRQSMNSMMRRRVLLELTVRALNMMLLLYNQHLVFEIGDYYISDDIVALLHHRHADGILKFQLECYNRQ